MRALVCGGRDFDDQPHLDRVLDHLKPAIEVLIQGGQRSERTVRHPTAGWIKHFYGADYFAKQWAYNEGVYCIEEKPDWDKHGKAAGPIRNQTMLDLHAPDLVIAFPGGRGTEDMVRRALQSEVPVVRIAARLR